jgi:glycosyltransferase involved in cell wall biosynthesis
MRILIHDYAGHPPQVFLSRELAARGHDVLHLYAADIETPRGALDRKPDDLKTFDIRPVRLSRPLKKHSYAVRQLQEIEYGFRLRKELLAFRPDIFVCSNTPLAALETAQAACRRRNIAFVFWLMDVYSAAVQGGLRGKLPVVGEAIVRGYRWLERRQLRRSDKVVLISEGFQRILDEWGIDRRRVAVLPLWAPLEELPERPKDNGWSRRLGIERTFNVIYSGTLGLKHNPALLAMIAERYRQRDDMRVVVISEGIGAEYLRREKAAKGLDNLLILPYQPFEDLPDVLGAADLLVTLLEPDAGVFSVPSKVLSYLCAGRAQAAAIPAENRAARVIADSGGGLTASPRDADAFRAVVGRLVADDGLRRRMGNDARIYAEREFNIRRIGDQFEGYLTDALASRAGAPAGASAGTVDRGYAPSDR